MAINNRTYSDAQNRAMDAAMLELSPAAACRRAAAGMLEDPDTRERLAAFTYNAGTAAVRKRRAERQRETRARATAEPLELLEDAARQLAGAAAALAGKVARKQRAGKLSPAELADAARALRETHRAVAPMLKPAGSGAGESPSPDASIGATPADGDTELAQWAQDAAAGA